MRRHWSILAAWFVVLAAAGIPLVTVLVESGSGGAELKQARYWMLLTRTVLLAATVTAIAVPLGASIAFVAARTRTPFRWFLTLALCLPFLFPPYVIANAWFLVLGRQGTLARWIGPEAGAATSPLLFSFAGGALVLVTSLLPLVILLAAAAFAGVHPSLEEAARMHQSWPNVLRNITLPLARPGLAVAAALVFVLALSEYAAVSFLRLPVVSGEVLQQFAAFYDFGAASASAMPMAVMAILLLILVQARAGSSAFRWPSTSPYAVPIRGWERWIAGAMALLAIAVVGVPFAALVGEGITRTALFEAWNRARDSVGWSLLYATAVATCVTALGFLLGYASSSSSGTRSIPIVSLVLFGIPSMVTGIACVAAWNRPPLGWLYGTPVALLMAMTLQYLAIGERGVAAALTQVPASMEDAARAGGAGWWRIVFSILMPQVRPALVFIWTVAFILCLRDSTLPLLLSPPGKDPLTARTLTLMANGSGAVIAALNLFSVALPLLALAIAVFSAKTYRLAHD